MAGRSESRATTTVSTLELACWLCRNRRPPIWRRLHRRNASGYICKLPLSNFKYYDIEMVGCFCSLWGTLDPGASVFSCLTRGRQYLACCVLACCAASVYPITEWNAQLMDSIVVNGDAYFVASIKTIKQRNYCFTLEDLNTECKLDLRFKVHIEHVVFGKLYQKPRGNRMNLAKALIYFFNHFRYGIFQIPSAGRALAIGFMPGHNGGYFMYNCQPRDRPFFDQAQGAPYLLRTRSLQVLLYCMVITLNVCTFNENFTMHKVEVVLKDKLRQGKTHTS